MVIKDRFVRGLIAGVTAGVVMSIIDYLFYYAGISNILFIDWGSVFLFGYQFRNTFEALLAQGGQLVFSGLLGVVFAYLLPVLGEEYHLIKGWFYSLIIWFSVHALLTLFEVQQLQPVPAGNIVSDFTTASIYGLFLAEVLVRMDMNVKI